ncbi:MAG TPA: M20/M25/M40 family metallo-hydrolase [Bacteroidetes bacterium]|nr:M20/M25/M40 family metallo-hydrolase [Bacteroidota bacterium]
MKKHLFYSVIFLLFFGNALSAQPIDTQHETYPYARASLSLLKELLAIHNDANFKKDIEKNVAWCAQKLSEHGFATNRLETPTVPLLLATYKQQLKGEPTVLFYFHIDGQPVDPSFWFQDDPYKAVLKEQKEGEGWVDIDWDNLQKKELDPEWRIFARSSSDDKSPFIMFLAALETMKARGQSLPYNLKIILDFEEEKSSPSLAQAVLDNKAALAADMLIIYDGPKHLNNQPTIAFGARGITSMTIKVFGPTYPLHSGHYGNYAPNPALRLSQLLASMKDENGRVTIPGYYDGIMLDEKTKKILAAVPDNEKELMAKLGIGETDKVGSTYQESLQYPSLNIRGLSSAWVGKEKRTIVPATAVAEIDLRLVVESDGKRLRELIKKHIEGQGYYITETKPTSRERVLHKKICQINMGKKITKAFRTDFGSGLGIWVFNTIKNTFGEDPIRLRTMGGTLPTSPFINTLNVPAVIVPLVNSDNNQHSPNENLRLGNFFDGTKTIYGLLTAPLPETGKE